MEVPAGENTSHFQRVCNLNGWEDSKLDILWVHLTSTALAYAESHPRARTSSSKALWEDMEARFGDERRAEIYKAELRTRLQREGESIPVLGQEVRKLVQNAYPGIGAERVEELAIERFKDSLTNSEQRMSVRQALP